MENEFQIDENPALKLAVEILNPRQTKRFNISKPVPAWQMHLAVRKSNSLSYSVIMKQHEEIVINMSCL